MDIVLTILGELIFVAFLILFFYRLKPWIGLAPLYILMGSYQYFQAILYKSTLITIFGDYYISHNATILFCASLFAILLIYIKEGVLTARNFILGTVLSNLAITILSLTIGLTDSVVKDIIYSPGLDPDLFSINPKMFFAGSIALILDAFIIVILYEYFYIKLKWLNLFARLLLTMLIIFNFDAIVFTAGSFWNSPQLETLMISQLISKSVVAVFFALVLFLYLRFFDLHKNDTSTVPEGAVDIFSILTYKGRLQKLQTEKSYSDENYQGIIESKTAELERNIQRFKILSSVRELRMDKYSASEQASEFLEKAQKAFNADACTIHLLDGDNLVLLASKGIDDSDLEKILPLATPYIREIIKKKKSIAIEDTSIDPWLKTDAGNVPTKFHYTSCAGVPLLTGTKVIGVLRLYSIRNMRLFTEFEVEHLQLVAAQIANTVENSRLFEQNEKHKEVLVKQIVARKKAEEGIVASEYRLRTILVNEPECVKLLNKKGEVLEMNPAGLAMIEADELEMVKGKAVISLINDPYKTAFAELTKNVFNGNSGKLEFEITGLKGTSRWLETNAVPFRDKEGIIVSLLGVTRDITDQKRAQSEILVMNQQFQDLSRHLQKVREEERTALSRELHDELGQQLTAIKMDLSWINNQTEDEKMTSKLEEALGLTDEAVTTIRRINSELRPALLDDLGLFASLEYQLDEFKKRFNIRCAMDTKMDEPNFEYYKAIAVFRVFQEGLTNIARHADAKEVNVSIQKSNGYMEMTLADNGKGFLEGIKRKSKSFGILGMHERAQMIQGTLQLDSIPGQGTTLKLLVPLYTKTTK